jgi:ATP-dependent DNA helicase RecG
MTLNELNEIMARGEDSRYKFKSNFTNVNDVAAELVAFSNSEGGVIIIGVDDKTLQVSGLAIDDIHRLNNLIANAASQSVKPAINPFSENIMHPNGLVIVVSVPRGINKPYMDNSGVFWVKSVGNKQKVTSREEIQRMFQSSGLIHGDETLVPSMTPEHIDQSVFSVFFKKEFEEELSEQQSGLDAILENMNLSRNGMLNIAGALLFAKEAHYHLPQFIVKAVSYPNNDIDVENYIDSRDITGSLAEIFKHTIAFLMMNTRHEQAGQSVNSLGVPVVPKIVFEEIIANALIHRDYFITAPIRIFMFSNRTEIISPGHLPNNLTINNIKSGNSNIRNPILASFATKLLPYRGLGNGIRRAIKAYPHIDFIDDRENNMFKVIIKNE